MGGFIVVLIFLAAAIALFFLQLFVPARWEKRVLIAANLLCIGIVLAHAIATALGYESPLGENWWDVKEKHYIREAGHSLIFSSWFLILSAFLGTLVGTLAQRVIVAFVRYWLKPNK